MVWLLAVSQRASRLVDTNCTAAERQNYYQIGVVYAL
jgi:hypothetical protein